MPFKSPPPDNTVQLHFTLTPCKNIERFWQKRQYQRILIGGHNGSLWEKIAELRYPVKLRCQSDLSIIKYISAIWFLLPAYVVRGKVIRGKVIFILGNVCLFTIGGCPVPGLGGVPHPRSGQGVPHPRSGGTPSQVGGVPKVPPTKTWDGVPSLPRPGTGYPPT